MRSLPVALLAALGSTGVAAQDPTKVPAQLAGHAVLAAATTVRPPADAPTDLKTSGKFTDPRGRRISTLGAILGTTGHALPIEGQPLQGLSGIKSMQDGTYWALSDNGFGTKANSPDAMLMLHRIRPNFAAGTVEVVQTVFLSDTEHQVPFRIANEATDERYLTGADFDIESIQPVDDGFWLGDEFGPYILKVKASGAVERVIETEVDGEPVRSPDHYAITTPATPTGAAFFNLARSRGFEGMAISDDGRTLFPLLEGPLWDAEAKDWEKVDGREALRILELDAETGEWSGRHWLYALEENGHKIGDFNMIDADTGLIIERDDGEGFAGQACPEGQPRPDCFGQPARSKRVYRIELNKPSEPVTKAAYIDLLDIQDPSGVARQGGSEGRFAFPFANIEGVDMVGEEHIAVANDNNFPYSAGREPQTQDDNELILLRVPELLSR